jgi:hypothetical protein
MPQRSKDADSVYARDLAVAPVKALQHVILLIKDGQVHPDQGRSDFFTHGNPLVPGTPAPIFQPGAPAFLSREVSAPVQGQFEKEDGYAHVQPKKEDDCIEV